MAAVDSVTLHVDEGEGFGFLRPKGAGKTTSVRTLVCLVAQRSGSATIGDYKFANRADQPKARKMESQGAPRWGAMKYLYQLRICAENITRLSGFGS